MNVRIINGDPAYAALFHSFGWYVTENVNAADLVCFTGGEDVTPSLYGDKAHPRTFNSVYRDSFEQDLFERAKGLEIPMVGICRGGQFLNVMSGGRMFQHVQNHATHAGHMLKDLQTGQEVFVSSTHHQMMMPSPDAVVVATAAEGGDREWFSGDIFHRDQSEEDYEVLYYPTTNALCFQPHPEFNGEKYQPMKEYFKQCLSRFLNV